jgi:glutamate formiminotransferase
VLECVVNLSEGRDEGRLAALAAAAGDDLLDLHRDAHHHRSVLTLVGEGAPRRVASAAVSLLDLSTHAGVHPRLGVVDVVPFVPLAGSELGDAIQARNRFAAWMADALDVPCFLYGPERSLPDVRRQAFAALTPDAGPSAPHPTAGATAVGARAVLVAYNLWLADADLATARSIATAVRRPALRTLGLQVGDQVQVSMNLVEPLVIGPERAYRLVQRGLQGSGARIERAELVGLVPDAVLAATPRADWARLDLDAERTIEARMAARGTRPG